MKEVISSPHAPQAIGPYSQAIRSGNTLYASGQIALDPETMELVEGGIKEQTERVIKNLEAVLSAAGMDLTNVVKTTVFLKDMDDFKAMNEVYAMYFTGRPPARSTVQVAKLPRDVMVEIDLIAVGNPE